MTSSTSSISFLNSFTHSNFRQIAADPTVKNRHSSVSFPQPKNLVVAASATVTDRTTRRRQRFPAGEMSAASAAGSLYEVLGIPTTASAREIKVAYRNLARVYHPDVVNVKNLNKQSSGMNANEFLKIQAAYSTLSDPDKRAKYDREVFRRNEMSLNLSSWRWTPAASSPMSGYCSKRRNWESDQCW